MTAGIGTVANSTQTNAPSNAVSGFSSVASSNVVLLVAVFGNNSGITGSKYSVSDTAGLTWSNKIPAISSIQEFDLYYAPAPSGVSSDTITVNQQAGASTYYGFMVIEVNGVDTTPLFDPSTAGENTAVNPAPSCSTSNANDVMVVFGEDVAGGSSTVSFSNSYTDGLEVTTWNTQIGNRQSFGYKVVSASGTQTTTITYGTNNNSNDFGFIIGLQAASGATNKTVTDSFSFSDSVSIKAKVPISDTLSFTDSVSVKVRLAVSDALHFADTVAINTIKVAISDAFSFADSVGVKVKLTVTDTLHFSDAVNVVGSWVRAFDRLLGLSRSPDKVIGMTHFPDKVKGLTHTPDKHIGVTHGRFP